MLGLKAQIRLPDSKLQGKQRGSLNEIQQAKNVNKLGKYLTPLLTTGFKVTEAG
jgi:hypothetical protein